MKTRCKMFDADILEATILNVDIFASDIPDFGIFRQIIGTAVTAPFALLDAYYAAVNTDPYAVKQLPKTASSAGIAIFHHDTVLLTCRTKNGIKFSITLEKL